MATATEIKVAISRLLASGLAQEQIAMMDEREPRWTKIEFRQPVDDLLKYGPSIEVDVAALEGEDTTAASARALAQIDTGAGGTGISPRLATKLRLIPIASGIVHQPGMTGIRVPYFNVRLSLPSAQLDMEVVGFPTLQPPHDILIGRDILSNCRLAVDFVSGLTCLLIKGNS
jgi:hypothetical protein